MPMMNSVNLFFGHAPRFQQVTLPRVIYTEPPGAWIVPIKIIESYANSAIGLPLPIYGLAFIVMQL
jgi:hypothetical protein